MIQVRDPRHSIFFLDNLFTFSADELKSMRTYVRARSQRPLFYTSPRERSVESYSKSGRLLSEIEIFHVKHHAEFEQLIPCIIKTLQAILCVHKTYLTKHASSMHASIRQFETSQRPQISLEDYIWRIANHTYTSPSTILSAFILLDRLMHNYHIVITEMNCYKFFFVAVRVASKVLEFRTLNNKNFAGIGGISNKHLNELEASFVGLLEFEVFISPTEFQKYASRLCVQEKEGYEATPS